MNEVIKKKTITVIWRASWIRTNNESDHNLIFAKKKDAEAFIKKIRADKRTYGNITRIELVEKIKKTTVVFKK